MKKIIRLTESDLVKLVKKVIKEQNSTKKITIVTPGKNAECTIKKNSDGSKSLTVRTETGREQTISVEDDSPVGNFMFEMGSDGNTMSILDSKSKKKKTIKAKTK